MEQQVDLGLSPGGGGLASRPRACHCLLSTSFSDPTPPPQQDLSKGSENPAGGWGRSGGTRCSPCAERAPVPAPQGHTHLGQDRREASKRAAFFHDANYVCQVGTEPGTALGINPLGNGAAPVVC